MMIGEVRYRRLDVSLSERNGDGMVTKFVCANGMRIRERVDTYSGR